MTFISNIPLQIYNSYSKPLTINNNYLFSGLDIGIPLNIFSNIFTNLHYGYDITTPKIIGIQFLLGYYTYMKDRYGDAIEYYENPFNTSKIEFYNYIYNNREIYQLTIFLSYIMFSILLLTNNNGNDISILYPFLPLLYLNGEYKNYKPSLNAIKPIYIGIMWTLASVILPCVIHEHNYNIMNYPLDYMPCFLTLFATSNFADVKDIAEDKINNITTLPIAIGEKKSNLISLIALSLSSILLIENPNFDNRIIINSIVELQNFGIMYLLYNNSFN